MPEFQIRAAHIEGKTRARGAVVARWVIMYLARQMTGQTLDAIGKRLGDRDHTTVMHGIKQAETLIATDAVLAERVRRLAVRLGRAASSAAADI